MNTQRTTQGAAALAVGIALILALAQMGTPLADDAVLKEGGTMSELSALVESGADHVESAEFAELLLAQRAAVFDLQTPEEFARLRLPGASNWTLGALLAPEGLAALEAARARGEEVVLVSRGMTHAAQAWMALAALGRAESVRVLEDGLSGFAAAVLLPSSLRDPAAPPLAPGDAVRFHELRRRVAGEQSAPAGPFAADPRRLEAPGVVTTAWLASNYARVVVLDGRTKVEDYDAGHLPGARHLPAGALRENRGTDAAVDELRAPAELARIYAALGIGPETEVVAYADAKMHDAAHALMGLFRLGHRRLAILDGGVERWRAEGRPLSAGEEAAPRVASATYPLDRADDAFAADLAAVARAQQDGSAVILDVRPADQFRGEKSTEARPGHVPGALNRPMALDQDGAAWRAESDLRSAYEALGIKPGAGVIVGCRTGHQAAFTWFTLRWLLGVERAQWWDGSWQEWAAEAALPAATGA